MPRKRCKRSVRDCRSVGGNHHPRAILPGRDNAQPTDRRSKTVQAVEDEHLTRVAKQQGAAMVRRRTGAVWHCAKARRAPSLLGRTGGTVSPECSRSGIGYRLASRSPAGIPSALASLMIVSRPGLRRRGARHQAPWEAARCAQRRTLDAPPAGPEAAPGDYVFSTSSGEQSSLATSALECSRRRSSAPTRTSPSTSCRRYHERITPHSLRRTFASVCTRSARTPASSWMRWATRTPRSRCASTDSR